MANEAQAQTDHAAHARGALLGTHVATLCTLSTRPGVEGTPYGSVAPFALSASGQPVVLLAHIAVHTHNLLHDARGSLLVTERGLDDPQAGWRISLVGDFERLVGEPEPPKAHAADVAVSTAELEELDARYQQRVPTAARYRQELGFCFWRLRIRQARFIVGFGSMGWIDGSRLLRDPGGEGIEAAASGAIAHMNDDHRHNLVEMCAGLHSVEPDNAEMVAIDRAGCFVRTRGPDRLLYFGFDEEVNASGLRAAIIAVLQRARGASVPQ